MQAFTRSIRVVVFALLTITSQIHLPSAHAYVPAAFVAAAPSTLIPAHQSQPHTLETSFLSNRVSADQPISNTLALRFVEMTGVYKNLSLLLLDEVKHSGTVQAAIKKHGFENVKLTVVRAIKKAQGDHAARWNTMLASVYQTHFGVDELNSILIKKEQSPHFKKLIDLQPTISSIVALKGENIFNDAHQQVMTLLSSDFVS